MIPPITNGGVIVFKETKLLKSFTISLHTLDFCFILPVYINDWDRLM